MNKEEEEAGSRLLEFGSNYTKVLREGEKYRLGRAGKGIEWADRVWNPVWGCNYKCKYCYARRFAKRIYETIAGFEGVDSGRLWRFEPTVFPRRLNVEFPAKPCVVFVDSMSDWKWWQPETKIIALELMRQNPHLLFVILTKGLDAYDSEVVPGEAVITYPSLSNVVLGITIENPYQLMQYVINHKRHNVMGANSKHLLCLEPFFGGYYDEKWLTEFDYVIAGGMTGKRYLTNDYVIETREFNDLVEKCEKLEIPLFLKDNLWKYVAKVGSVMSREEFWGEMEHGRHGFDGGERTGEERGGEQIEN